MCDDSVCSNQGLEQVQSSWPLASERLVKPVLNLQTPTQKHQFSLSVRDQGTQYTKKYFFSKFSLFEEIIYLIIFKMHHFFYFSCFRNIWVILFKWLYCIVQYCNIASLAKTVNYVSKCCQSPPYKDMSCRISVI